MLNEAIIGMANEMSRVAMVTASFGRIPRNLEAGDIDWLDIAHDAGNRARTQVDDHKIVLRAVQHLAMASYLLGLYANRKPALERIAIAALEEWEYAGYAARRLGVRPADILSSLTETMPLPQS
jgi:hypothetical protein